MPARLLVLAAVLAAVVTSQAHADSASEAQFFDSLARRAYEAGDYGEAFEAFLLVQQVAPSPRALYNLAISADLAGKNDVAFEQYREYLASDDPDADRRRDAEQRAERLESKLSLLEITSNPPGAAIYVDRKELGQYGVTPRTIAVGSGPHRVLLELDGYRAEALPVDARTGSVVPARATLEPRFGVVALDLIPPSAKVEFLRDETPVSFSLEAGGYRLPIARYTLRASAPGYLPSQTRLVVRENGAENLTLALTPLPRPTGRLLVASNKPAADVFVDGRRMAVTPAALPEVTVGVHDVEVRAGAQSAKRRVTIRAGHATYVELDVGKGAR
jgi:outer membrane receptor for ferrienterochelin and colicins